MKTLISLFVILACGLGATAQENRAQAVQILKKALSKCQRIESWKQL